MVTPLEIAALQYAKNQKREVIIYLSDNRIHGFDIQDV